MFIEHAHGCLGAWEGGPVVPGPPPLGPWGASRELPGGGVPAQTTRPTSTTTTLITCPKSMSISNVLGSILGPSWGSFSVLVAPFST